MKLDASGIAASAFSFILRRGLRMSPVLCIVASGLFSALVVNQPALVRTSYARRVALPPLCALDPSQAVDISQTAEAFSTQAVEVAALASQTAEAMSAQAAEAAAEAAAQAKAQALEATEQAARAQAEAIASTKAQYDAIVKALEDAGPIKVSAGVLALILAVRAILGALEAVKPLLLPSLIAFVGIFEAYLATEISAKLPFLGDSMQVYINLVGFTAVTVGGSILYAKASSMAKAAVESVTKPTSSKASKLADAVPAAQRRPLGGIAIENPFRAPDERSYVNRAKSQRGQPQGKGKGKGKK